MEVKVVTWLKINIWPIISSIYAFGEKKTKIRFATFWLAYSTVWLLRGFSTSNMLGATRRIYLWSKINIFDNFTFKRGNFELARVKKAIWCPVESHNTGTENAMLPRLSVNLPRQFADQPSLSLNLCATERSLDCNITDPSWEFYRTWSFILFGNCVEGRELCWSSGMPTVNRKNIGLKAESSNRGWRFGLVHRK